MINKTTTANDTIFLRIKKYIFVYFLFLIICRLLKKIVHKKMEKKID